MGRIKKCRTIELNIPGMSCHCFGPTSMTGEEMRKLAQDTLQPDELQSLIYQDIDNLTMDDACAKMGVSKTVYAGIYKSARIKVTTMLMQGSILRVCTKSSS